MVVRSVHQRRSGYTGYHHLQSVKHAHTHKKLLAEGHGVERIENIRHVGGNNALAGQGDLSCRCGSSHSNLYYGRLREKTVGTRRAAEKKSGGEGLGESWKFWRRFCVRGAGAFRGELNHHRLNKERNVWDSLFVLLGRAALPP